MRIKTLASLLALPLLALAALSASAQSASPVGRWKTIDDETGKPMTIVEVYQAKNGTYAAKVVETLYAPNASCTECEGKDKGKPIIGMLVLWNLKPISGGWGNGSGFKPSTGDSFKAKSVKLTNGGNNLEIEGCKLMFCRTAKWVKVS